MKIKCFLLQVLKCVINSVQEIRLIIFQRSLFSKTTNFLEQINECLNFIFPKMFD